MTVVGVSGGGVFGIPMGSAKFSKGFVTEMHHSL